MGSRRWITNKLRHLSYIVGREISGIINTRAKDQGQKAILLFCQSQIMEEHLLNFMEQLEERPEYKFYLWFGEEHVPENTHGRKQSR